MSILSNFFQFGEKIDKYDFRVVNERDVRASAGIMFLFGIISLFSFILTKNLFWANLFTATFIIEFVLRVFVNSVYTPYMILGHIVVSNQTPDWVEASPKRFAWSLGVILGAIMSYYILLDIITPARIIICVLCLVLLFLESSFGICLGCIVYKLFDKKLNKCAGDTCEVQPKKQSIMPKFIALVLFMGLFYGLFTALKEYKYYGTTSSLLTQAQKDSIEFGSFDEVDEDESTSTIQIKDCEPPQFAIDMGHRDVWLEHNGCKK